VTGQKWNSELDLGTNIFQMRSFLSPILLQPTLDSLCSYIHSCKRNCITDTTSVINVMLCSLQKFFKMNIFSENFYSSSVMNQ
jgi:hypothetical protein